MHIRLSNSKFMHNTWHVLMSIVVHLFHSLYDFNLYHRYVEMAIQTLSDTETLTAKDLFMHEYF